MTGVTTSPDAFRPPWWQTLNVIFLLACVSMYFGTGWSLILFSFPIAPKLTPSTYYLQFVPQVESATWFFTRMTIAMIASAALMLWKEWFTGYRWVPAVVLAGVITATVLTEMGIFPVNVEMAAGIKDQARLNEVLAHWMRLNTMRVWLWTGQWLAMASYVASKTARAVPLP